MTLPSRRKHRTTAPRTWRPGTACRLALLAALSAAAPAAAQQPAPFRAPAVYASPYPTTVGQPAARPAPPGQPVQQPAAAPRAAQPDGAPAGYRAVSGDAPRAAAGGGQVMYFHKPADALAADGGPDAGAVALAAQPPVVPPAVPDVPPPPPGFTPPLPAAPPIAAVPPIPVAIPAPAVQDAPAPAPQPPVTAQPTPKLGNPPAPGALSPEVTQLPPRDKIFLMYDDATLEKAIIDRTKEDARRRQQGGDPKVQPKLVEGNWQFPALPPIVPAGTKYVSRTGTMPPAKVVFEPGFVVHRRLHFEEKNSERQGWDFGLMSPVVSAAYFYKDVLLWPNSLASGAVTGFWDTSAGKCLPGSPTPYYLYPPGLTITGTAVEGLVITGAAFIIP